MLHDMTQKDRVELAALGDDPLRLFLGQIAGIDVVALLAGDLGGDRIGLDADDLRIAGAAQGSISEPSLQPTSIALPGSWRATAVVIRSSRCRGRWKPVV